MFSLAQAAKATGKSRPTIARAIKNGKLSASRADDGSYEIDPAELARVFPLAGHESGTMKQTVPGNGAGTVATLVPGVMTIKPQTLHLCGDHKSYKLLVVVYPLRHVYQVEPPQPGLYPPVASNQ